MLHAAEITAKPSDAAPANTKLPLAGNTALPTGPTGSALAGAGVTNMSWVGSSQIKGKQDETSAFAMMFTIALN